MAQPATGTHTTPSGPMTPASGSSTSTPVLTAPALGSTITNQGNIPLILTAMRSYNLNKLTDPNYLTWATRMTLMLKRVDLWDIVNDTTQPSATHNADWIAKNLQAQVELMFHLRDPQVQMVRRCNTSAEIWTLLRSNYHHEDLITQVASLKKLLVSSLAENQEILKFLDEWCMLLDNALLAGLQFDSNLQSKLLLAALPSSWRPFITTQASVGNLTVESLMARIWQEEIMRNGAHNTSGVVLTPSTQ
jgi:hypothetical protein